MSLENSLSGSHRDHFIPSSSSNSIHLTSFNINYSSYFIEKIKKSKENFLIFSPLNLPTYLHLYPYTVPSLLFKWISCLFSYLRMNSLFGQSIKSGSWKVTEGLLRESFMKDRFTKVWAELRGLTHQASKHLGSGNSEHSEAAGRASCSCNTQRPVTMGGLHDRSSGFRKRTTATARPWPRRKAARRINIPTSLSSLS